MKRQASGMRIVVGGGLWAALGMAACYVGPVGLGYTSADGGPGPMLPDAVASAQDGTSPDGAGIDAAVEPSNDPNEWAYVYARYFAADTVGHCGSAGCHESERSGFRCGATKDSCFEGLVAAGLIDPADPKASTLAIVGQSPLAWFGGTAGRMPADSPLTNEEAAGAVVHWVRAGARNDGSLADASTDAHALDAAPDVLVTDAGTDAHHDAGDAGPVTWTSLYATYFGPNTPGHCGNTSCHKTTNTGFKCGTTKATCYSGLVAAGLVNATTPSKSTIVDPALSPLAWINGGPMPKDNAVPNAAAKAALQAWVALGAPNN